MQSKLVFTDERFPGIEIWNHGRCMFNIVNASLARFSETNYEIDCFNHQEDKLSYDVSPEFAEQVAKAKFDEMEQDANHR